jgi:shikimate dehydrogenase
VIPLPLTAADVTDIRLGLIGDNIRTSRSPALHALAGRLCGLRVSYDLLIPPDLGLSLAEVLDAAQAAGVRGVNVTLPYKERVLPLVRPASDEVARLGAVNTVLFGPGGPVGYNTDFTGFTAAFRAGFGDTSPGRTAVIGVGGAGRAVAFALAGMGAALVLIDTNTDKAHALARDLPGGAEVAGLDALAGCDGIVNATPLGMTGYPGSPVPEGAFPRVAWAFDAVYTPVATPFRTQAIARGAAFLSGWELFFCQGVDAFALFTGHRPDTGALREALGDAPPLPCEMASG